MSGRQAARETVFYPGWKTNKDVLSFFYAKGTPKLATDHTVLRCILRAYLDQEGCRV